MTININGTTGISGVDGSAGTPAIQGSDTNTGVFFGTNTIDLSTDGTSRLSIGTDGDLNVDSGTLFVDASTNRVGIGTTSPISHLHVDGTGSVTMRVSSSDNSLFIQAGASSGSTFHEYKTLYRIVDTDNGERARFDSSGRLLVGHTSAVTNLRFGGSGDFGARQYIYGANQGFNNGLAILNYDATASIPAILKLGSSRNDTPGNNGLVGNADNCCSIQMMGNDGVRFIDLVRLDAVVDSSPGEGDMPGSFRVNVTRNGQSTVTERLRISENGRTSVFTTDTDAFEVGDTTGTGTERKTIRAFHSATAVQNGTEMFFVRNNGDVRNATGSYSSISDAKLKENIVDAPSQWEDIKALQVRKFNFTEESNQARHTQIGLIAQEAELVCPGLVDNDPDRDQNGEDLGTVTKGVKYSVLYMKSVKALQEAMERIETLEARLSVLEGGAN